MTPERLETFRKFTDEAGMLATVEAANTALRLALRECLEFIDALIARDRRSSTEVHLLKLWIADLQSGMYINCVYCGHNYGPSENLPSAHADVLKRHIAECPEHPMAALLRSTKGADHLCQALLACRDGVTNELISGVREACAKAIAQAEGCS